MTKWRWDCAELVEAYLKRHDYSDDAIDGANPKDVRIPSGAWN